MQDPQVSASCGHSPIDGRCQFLCNDYSSNVEGLCYLSCFQEEYRKEAFTALGHYPYVIQFNMFYIKSPAAVTVHITPPMQTGGHLHTQLDSIPNQPQTVVTIGECTTCNFKKQSYSSSLRPVYKGQCPGSCSNSLDTYKEISMIRFTYFANKLGSKHSVKNLIKFESSAIGYELRDPIMYFSEAELPITDSKVSIQNDDVTLSVNEHQITLKRHSQKLKAFIHDFVSSCWNDSTDTLLNVLGIEGPTGLLSPDYIIPETKCVLEVATCATDNEKSINDMFRDKVSKYQGDLKQVGAKFFVIVISPQKVFTNTTISKAMVDELSKRMRMVYPLKQKMIQLLGEDITDDEFNENERLTKLMFSKMPTCPQIDEKYKYNIDEIKECSTGLLHHESISAAKILLSRFESTKTIHNASRNDLNNYMSKFTSENTRNDLKRVSNVPFILPGVDAGYTDSCFEGNQTLKKIWCEALSKEKPNESEITLKLVEMNLESEFKHTTKKAMMTKIPLTYEEKADAALSGVGGKAYKDEDEVKKHRELSKLSFHPLVDTSDIENFVSQDLLVSDGTENKYMPYLLKTAVKQSKSLSCSEGDNKSTELWEQLLKTDFMKYSMMMTNTFMELAYTYKHWTFHYEFLLKKLPGGIWMLIYNPKSTIFVSFAFPKHGAKLWDRGRLGPTIYESTSHYFTDWSSFDNSQLEHFIKFGPYMGSCLTELMNSSESRSDKYSKYTRDCIPHLLLLYCNNKTDAEELITSQRYLFMKLLEDVGKSPYVFVDRFPKVLRSRLTAYYLKKTMDLMEYYESNSITKVPRQGEEMILYDYMNIKSLFSKEFISLNSKVNEFYFGYVVSKERNTGKDKTFKVLTKLIKQEQKFRDTVTGSIFTRNEEYKEFTSNMPLLKFFTSAFSDLLVTKFGPEYKEKIMNDFVHSAARTNFSDLATLKVSSRDHSKDVTVPLGSDSTEQTFERLKKDFPEEMMKRPFCMESMTQIIKRYEADTKKKIHHISQLAPWCLKKLLEKGWFDSDQFDKSQHGGEREIHVLEFMARIVQYFVELVSRTICSYFPSETTVNPETKDRFVRDHYAKSKEMFGNSFTTISKSADATTWCQFHHSSHFAAMFQAILPDELKEFTLSALSLWPRKRLSFPLKQSSSLAANMKLKTSNSTYMRFKEEFEEGKGMFVKARGNLIEVISGMFQGILHTTSSLYHTMIQEVMKQVMITACKGRMRMEKVLITVIQGSDDSGCMISVPGKPSLKIMQQLKRLLLWKERVSPYLSVFCNEAKSSIGTHDLIEYNSEWHVRHMLIKPTFRWVSASQELTVTERFIDRFRIYNNMITECLTGGASTLECSVIQLFQATMHYILMGLGNEKSIEIKTRYLELLLENPEPVFGFFPLDEDVSCGVPGVEFQLYKLYCNTNFGTNLRVLGDSEMSMDYSPEDLPNWMKTKDLSSIRLKFSNMKVFYRVLERMNLEPLEDAIKAVEEDPVILFSRANTWTDEQHNLVLKVFSKGVKESISNKSSMLRMASSSAYILSSKCFSDNSTGKQEKKVVQNPDGTSTTIVTSEKHTLISLMIKHKNKIASLTKDFSNKSTLFPFYEEYDKISSDIENLKRNGVVLDQYVKRTSKVKISVIPKPVGEIDVIDMCKRRWFGKGVHSLSQGQFKRKWSEMIEKFKFIDDSQGIEGLEKTARNLNLNIVQTKMFLESMTVRSRSIVLYDSSSKSGNLGFALSRIYWPNTKISLPVSTLEDKITELRCKLFSVLTFWYTKEYSMEICKSLIANDYSLSQSYIQIPSHGTKLKIISEVIKGTSNHDLIHRIEASKKGLLGSFVQQQRGRGNKRKGEGIWQGSICGIGTRIHMEGNTCDHIIVNSLYDTVTFGWHLNQFMNEATLVMPSVSSVKNSKTNCWLSSEGRILISREPRGVPIFQDSSMKVVSTEETANMTWQVDVNNNNIRIRARDPITSSLFTILSDTITNRDWVSGVSLEVDDPVFNKWARGESLHMPMFERMLYESFPSTRHQFMLKKDDFNNSTLRNKYNWDFKKMQQVLRTGILGRGHELDSDRMLSDGEGEAINNDVLDRFSAMLSSVVDKFEEDLDQDIEDWAAEVDMEEDMNTNMWGVDMNEIEEEELKANLNLFVDASGDEFYELVDRNDLLKNFSMPSTMRFFSPIEHMNMVMNKETLRDSIISQRNAPNLLGMIYTITTGKFSVGKDDGLASEVIDVEEEISNVSSSVSRPGALLNLSLDEIRIHIANLQQQLEFSSKTVSRRILRLLGVYKDREEEILNRIDPRTHDLVMLNSTLILKQLVDFFSNNNIFPIDISALDSTLKENLFSTFVRTETNRCAILSQSEKEEVSLHLSTSSISRGSLQSISLAYNLNIVLRTSSEIETISNVGEEHKTIVLDVSELSLP